VDRPLANRFGNWPCVLSFVFVLSCRDAPGGSRIGERLGVSSPESEEQSPNARILPDPLGAGAPQKSSKSEAVAEAHEGVVERLPVRPWSLQSQLQEDLLTQTTPTGYRASLSFAWPEAHRTMRTSTEELPLWPTFEVELLRETNERAARLRLIARGSSGPFPAGTELRSRADRLGHALLWPDGRSYRVVPPGALRALMLDRRVDRVPYVDAKMKLLEGGPEGESRLVEITTAIGRARLHTAHLKDLPYAPILLCKALLELIRVDGNDQLCPSGHLPLKLEIVWSEERHLVIELGELRPASDLMIERFRIPPELPILKSGELPPFENYLLREAEREKTLLLTKVQEPPLSVAPEQVAAGHGASPSSLLLPQPQNEIELRNDFDRPVFVIMNRIPVLLLGPSELIRLYTKGGQVSLSARDFLGEVVVAEQPINVPIRLHFGKKAELAPSAPL
jgi:hypothetical protein